MTDLQQLEALLAKAKGTNWSTEIAGDESFEFARGGGTIASKNCHTRVHVMPGYRCHFEAEFDAAGNILNIGQWDEI